MKKFRIILASVLVLALAGTLFAFTIQKGSAENNKPFTSQTFYFTGPTESSTNIENPDKWTTTAPPFTAGTAHLYSITFDDNAMTGYPLDNSKPNATVLSRVSSNWSAGANSGSFSSPVISYVNKQ